VLFRAQAGRSPRGIPFEDSEPGSDGSSSSSGSSSDEDAPPLPALGQDGTGVLCDGNPPAGT
jgi:hypothetical protein